MNAEITNEVDNFDALGLFASETLRDEIMEHLPAWHYEGIARIRYAPSEFEHYYLAGDKSVLGCYRPSTHEIFVNSFDMEVLVASLSRLKDAAARWTDSLEFLGRKRMPVEETADLFECYRNQVFGTIYHEIGHHLYRQICGVDEEFRNRWDSLFYRSSRKVSQYAATNAEENFAECYRVYVCLRNVINANVFRQECTAMREVFARGGIRIS